MFQKLRIKELECFHHKEGVFEELSVFNLNWTLHTASVYQNITWSLICVCRFYGSAKK